VLELGVTGACNARIRRACASGSMFLFSWRERVNVLEVKW
jgi:hypothetical protein